MNIKPYMKTVVAVAFAAVSAAKIGIADDVMSTDDWIQVAIGALTALGVWMVPNKPASNDATAK